MTTHTYKATVTREDRWWMIHVPEIRGLSQARRLSEADAMARSLIAITLNIPADSFDVDVEVERVGKVQVADRTARLRAARETAIRIEHDVQTDAENLARDLANEGIPLRDIGDILGISYQRAHQLVSR
ncbi:MAG: HicB family toxin-antitoxin system [Acidimicrobiales bacterium]